ncbi:glycosyltransferase family 4 protein [Flavobacterium cheongpyeongense]|uniref:Glycosyltransferase family 4 protein n=1 Tax=Flavobacterium cheongpyeongense TaxID=2212651 RepID=A0A2V4BTV1_9FLAO|nr:glycosyltransferase family 4 protein [Flavobacterium cheongpyeongense]PXY41992.1 glycosyltransferase family 4 protein [Flavobacterium cheongpyeongense]
MKLLYCIPSLYNAGGMERVISEKVNYLIQLPYYEITIVTTDQKQRDIRFPLDERIRLIHLNIDFDGHYSENLFTKYFLHQRKLKKYKKTLIQLIRDLEVNICISLCGKEIDFLNGLPVKCKKVAEMHFGMNVRKQFLMSRHKGFLWGWLGEIRTCQLKKATKKLDKLVVLTEADQEKWQKTHKNITQIPNSNPFDNKTVSKLLNKRVISVGRLDAQKGYDMLIDAWELVAVKNPDWVLDIFGIGEWELKLNNRIQELNLTGKINLCGLTSDTVPHYINSSIYVMSSRYEGLPMVLIEAMSCGLPIISFDCEYGPRQLINDGQNGLLVNPNDIIHLAEKISFLIEDKDLRLKMGKQALESVKEYSKEPIMQRWVELFNQLC